MKLGYDFAGYGVKKKQDLSFHHTIIAHKDSKIYGIGEGYLYWNGAILVQNTSHNYIHTIQNIDEEIYYLINSELIDENIKGKIDIENLIKIHDLLTYFEREHCSDRTKKGNPIIREEYTRRLIRK
nr:MAG TPA: hypothetical protein [Caudoviricetes sp.]